MCSERVVVGDKEETLGLLLKFHKVSKGSEVVAQMELSRRTDTTQNTFFHTYLLFYFVVNTLTKYKNTLSLSINANNYVLLRRKIDDNSLLAERKYHKKEDENILEVANLCAPYEEICHSIFLLYASARAF